MMRCMIVEDEQLVRQLIEDNISQVPYLNLIASCKNAMEALDVLEKSTIDLIFLDVQMTTLTGLQFLKSLHHPPLVILITAYEKYAIEGFELHVVDYVLKPFSFERFLKACNRANDLFKLRQLGKDPSGEISHFFVNVEYTLVKVILAEIEYVEGLKDYIKIFLTGASKPIVTHMTMKGIEERLPSNQFIRTHRSYIVAKAKITKIRSDFVYINETEIPVSPFYKDNLNQSLFS